MFRLATNGSGFTILRSLGSEWFDSFGPRAAVTEVPDGGLYGTTEKGGLHNLGTVFRLQKDGTLFAVLHDFGPSTAEGAEPIGPLLHASDGWLYGSTKRGGARDWGTLFRMEINGSNFMTLHHFGTNNLDASSPGSALTEGRDGAIYGTVGGSGFSGGTVYRINKDGSDYTILRSFTNSTDPQRPLGGVIQGNDGMLYGTSMAGGVNDGGTVYRLSTNGSAYGIIRSLGDSFSLMWPTASVIEGKDGDLYGTTRLNGSVYRTSKFGFVTILHTFTNSPDGSDALAELVQGPDGTLYGTTASGGRLGGGTIYRISASGSGYVVLKSFEQKGNGDGVAPENELISGSDGNLYGTTRWGGLTDGGVVFKSSKDGSNYSVLVQFSGSNGVAPIAPLWEGQDGFLYGTTAGGNYYGTVFKVAKDGSGFRTTYIFRDDNVGYQPLAGLVQSANGTLYGTTVSGSVSGYGAIFSITTNGTVTQVHAFAPADGLIPTQRLIEGSDGVLYGATSRSGGGGFDGSIFRVTKEGDYTVLHRFRTTNPIDGFENDSPLIEGSDGRLYGTTRSGGGLEGGTVYGINKTGTHYRILHHFGIAPGGFPEAPRGALVEGVNGILYGTIERGGEFGNGAVFQVRKEGADYSLIYSFQATRDAEKNPRTGLASDRDGILYGTTFQGGSMNLGAIFRLDPRQARLSIERDGPNVRLHWPVTLSTDVIEHADPESLITNWSFFAAPVVLSNNVNEVRLRASSNALFRVKRM